jgi:hypothetical protein
MARKWTEGWEFQDTIGYCTGSDFGIPVVGIDTTVKRSGAASMYIGTLSNTNGWLYKAFDTGMSEFYFRFAVYLDPYLTGLTVPQIQFRTGDTITSYLTFGTCYLINLYVGGVWKDVSSTYLYERIWYLVEVHYKVSATVGVCQIKVDGMSVLDMDFSGNTGTGTIDNIKFWVPTSYAGVISNSYFDDIALNDTTGVADNSWCGEGKVVVMLPNDDSAPLQLTPSAAVHHHLLVDEVPTDGNTTYVEGSVINEEDMYKLTPSGLVNVDINRVWTEARSMKTAAVDGHVALITKAAGGAEVSGGDVDLLTTYTTKVLGTGQTVNPVDTNPWEVADIDLIEIGPRTR